MSPLTSKVLEVEGLIHNVQSLPCVRCGACKALCPTYIVDATEGMSARGRIMLLKKFIERQIEPSELLAERIFSCLLCSACNRLCPLGINITDAIYKGRVSLIDLNKKRKLISLLLLHGFKKPSIVFKIIRLLEAIGDTFPVNKMQPFKALRDLKIRLPDSALRDEIYIFKASRPKARIAVFSGCTVNFLYPNIGRSLIYFLNKLDYDVILPRGEVCCGAPLVGLGFEEEAAELAKKNLNIFKKMNVEAVIGLCPTCVHFIKNEYKKLIGDQIDAATEISQFSKKMVRTNPQSQIPSLQKIVYHDPCHSIYGLDIKAEPRQILKSMGFDILNSESGCCGFGGTFRLLYQELSEEILEKRVEEYKDAEMIITSCPNCILQLKSKITDKPIKHLAEIINELTGEKR